MLINGATGAPVAFCQEKFNFKWVRSGLRLRNLPSACKYAQNECFA